MLQKDGGVGYTSYSNMVIKVVFCALKVCRNTNPTSKYPRPQKSEEDYFRD